MTLTLSGRDLSSLESNHAEIYISSSGATSLGDTSTWVQVAGTYTEAVNPVNWGMNVSGRLYYNGTEPRRSVLAMASLSATTVEDAVVMEFGIAKNGTIITSGIRRQAFVLGADTESVSTMVRTPVVPGDYLAVVMRNVTSATNATVVLLNLVVVDYRF